MTASFLTLGILRGRGRYSNLAVTLRALPADHDRLQEAQSFEYWAD
jgi:hypothetical protein